MNKQPIFVYLDQNHWIYLSQAYHNHPDGQQYKPVLEKITHLVNNDKIRMPLSVYHILETQKIQNNGQRERLAEVMTNLSRTWGIAVVDSIAPIEIQIAGARVFGYARPKQPKVFSQGISLILNVDTETLFDRIIKEANVDPQTAKQALSQFKEYLRSPTTLNLLLTNGIEEKESFTKSINDYKLGIKQFARQSKDVRDATSYFATSQSRLKEKIILDYLTGEETRSIFNKALSVYGISIDNITRKGKKNAITFLESIPTLDVEATLFALRNMQHDREIEENDWADIRSLVVAIPYCDMVVTEKFFHNLAIRSRLNKKYNTIILRNLTDILDYL